MKTDSGYMYGQNWHNTNEIGKKMIANDVEKKNANIVDQNGQHKEQKKTSGRKW